MSMTDGFLCREIISGLRYGTVNIHYVGPALGWGGVGEGSSTNPKLAASKKISMCLDIIFLLVLRGKVRGTANGDRT